MGKIFKIAVPVLIGIFVIVLTYYDYRDSFVEDKTQEQLSEEREILAVPDSSKILQSINEYRDSPLQWDDTAAQVAQAVATFVGREQEATTVEQFDYVKIFKDLNYERGAVKPVVVYNVPSVTEAIKAVHNQKGGSFWSREDVQYVGVGTWEKANADKIKTVVVVLLTAD